MKSLYIIPSALLAAVLLVTSSCSGSSLKGTSTIGSTPEVEKRIDALLSKMTLEEKIGQMNQLSVGGPVENYAEAIRSGQVGSILNDVDPARLNELQKIAVEQSRLGIPLIVGRDVIHGFRTIFPIPLGIAATFDPDLAREGARVAAREATSTGVRWTFSPMLDIARDPRWGRIAEGSGEDTFLDSEMAKAMVRGYQGDILDSTSMAACVKHFVGYGAAEGGRDYNSTFITERQLRNFYLPPFKAGIEAGAMTVMTSFNDNDGVPSTGNKFVVDEVLRDEWNFDGFVVTDWDSMGEMIAHGFASDRKHAAELSINAGVDMDMMTLGFLGELKKLVEEGKVKVSQIDNSVRNILRVKFLLGLFENPYVDPSKIEAYTEENLLAARKTVEESVILLKNDKGTLPLNDKSIRTILVTGPMADAPYEQMGTWVFDGQAEHTVTPLSALREKFASTPVRIVYEPGLKFTRESRQSYPEVSAAARNADVILAFLGEEAILSGEAHCLADLNLIGGQSALLEELHKSGKPVVTVVMAGRPLTIERDLPNTDALLYAFHPGTMGGPAITRLLFGDVVPSGKTPITFLRTVGQVPLYYNHNNTGRPYDNNTLLGDIPLGAAQTSLGNTSYYLDYGAYPLFPFGYGLSYTTFSYSDLSLDKKQYSEDDTIHISFRLSNTGNFDAEEVAQVYVRDMVGSVTRPVKELKAFRRVPLAKDESRTVTIDLPVKDLAFWGLDMEYGVESGEFQLMVGGDSRASMKVNFTVK